MLKRILVLSTLLCSSIYAMEQNFGGNENAFLSQQSLPQQLTPPPHQAFTSFVDHYQEMLRESAEKSKTIHSQAEEISDLTESLDKARQNSSTVNEILAGMLEEGDFAEDAFDSLAKLIAKKLSMAKQASYGEIIDGDEDENTNTLFGRITQKQKIISAAEIAKSSAAGQSDEGFYEKSLAEVITILGQRQKDGFVAARNAASQNDEGFWDKSLAEVITILSQREKDAALHAGRVSAEVVALTRESKILHERVSTFDLMLEELAGLREENSRLKLTADEQAEKLLAYIPQQYQEDVITTDK